jgi:DNA-binding CsgD family transcriptional regulator
MALYIDGLYQLDPYHQLTLSRSRGLFRIRDIMPEAFLESEFFNLFYRFTSVIDELRYVVPLGSETSVHIFVERESAPGPFTDDEIARFRALEPLVSSFSAKHIAWHEASTQTPSGARSSFDLREKIRSMPPGGLTNRETDTVELMLKGHSTKSLARELGIDDGTAANHKRNIYAKLLVHSQAQLFDLFLRTLAAES